MRALIQPILIASIVLAVACGEEEMPEPMQGDQSPATAQEAGAPINGGTGGGAGDADATGGPRQDGSVSPGSASDAGPQAPRDGAVAASDATHATDAAGDGGARDASGAPGDAASGSGDSPCPSDGPCKILPFGDSITYGIGSSDSSSYRAELFKLARAAGQEITFVGSVQSGPSTVDGVSFPRANEGHSGWTISRLAGRVPSPALTGKPNIVLLMAGTNDMYMSPGPAEAPTRLGELIDKLIAADPAMYIVVAQITPLSTSDSSVKTFNAALPAVVQARAMAGKHVTLVDMHTSFPSGALADGVHPNATGYKWMAGVWYNAIKGWLR